jgi:hypothetical protein
MRKVVTANIAKSIQNCGLDRFRVARCIRHRMRQEITR